ncbi:phage tail assembly protein [Sphingobium cupriresistens]|uniref:Tail protein n=1 Tax=Sphingobium cupriresistens LL01 TaxID=1420583 RepID=A0A0J8AWP4_9SPHN|nr:phage tail assembly protein [Sphingobium cupriresistens]KMS58585.1 hypothetical protein V473_10915 [Sphingobium cupriresistens LL01]
MNDQPTSPQMSSVTLDAPIVSGDITISEVKVRKPQAGELRGLSLSALLNLDYAALENLLPRITIPTLTKAQIIAMDPSDFTQLGSEVMDFLLPKGAKAALSPNG